MAARPTLSGDALVAALGFSSARSFQRAKQQGRITVPLYPLQGRKGVYAFVEDIERLRRRRDTAAVSEQAETEKPLTNRPRRAP